MPIASLLHRHGECLGLELLFPLGAAAAASQGIVPDT